MAEVELPNPEELEEKRDKVFSRRVALITAIYAVVLAIASLGGNNAMKEMLVAQQETTNQWAYYQAKVVREHMNRANRMVMDTYLAEPSTLKGAERAKFEALAAKFGDEEKRMAADKKEIEKDAQKFAGVRNLNQSKDPYFDYAEVMLQIAIVLASISILSTSRTMFWCSTVLAVLGVLLTLNGFFLLAKVPFLHTH